jgi:hypothetical protein
LLSSHQSGFAESNERYTTGLGRKSGFPAHSSTFLEGV